MKETASINKDGVLIYKKKLKQIMKKVALTSRYIRREGKFCFCFVFVLFLRIYCAEILYFYYFFMVCCSGTKVSNPESGHENSSVICFTFMRWISFFLIFFSGIYSAFQISVTFPIRAPRTGKRDVPTRLKRD